MCSGEWNYLTNINDALTKDIKIKNFISHPQYYATEIIACHNITSVGLSKEAINNDYVRPPCLLLVDSNNYQEFLAAGWSYLPSEPSYHLHTMKLDR